MADTYDEIIEEIEQLDGCSENYTKYLNAHGLRKQHQWASTDMALDIARRVREAVGGDPSEWWVECNGERVKIGDKVETYNNENEVFALGPERVIYDNGYHFDSIRADLVHKVIPDTREKIIEDTLDKLDQTGMYRTSLVTESVEQAVDRAMKLGAEQ